jgi:hypothetical protein
MQENPLLKKIDWFFTSSAWTNVFTLTVVLPLARTTFDHLPCRVRIGTNIPKANIFRFENCWLSHPECLEQIKNTWITPVNASNSAPVLSAKFKLLRRVLKHWSRNISNLSKLIANCNMTISQEIRILYSNESKFRNIIKEHIRTLLRMQNQYWRQRLTYRITQYGDENTKFFHSMATERYRRNVISQIIDDTARMVIDHGAKSALFWQEFKRRLGSSVQTTTQFNLQDIVQRHSNLDHLCSPITGSSLSFLLIRPLALMVLIIRSL